MKNFKKVLVGLDLSPMDGVLIQHTVNMARFLGIESVHFVHVANDLTLSEEITETYPNLLDSTDESIEKGVGDTIVQAGFPEGVSFVVEAKKGNPTETIIKHAKANDIDLVIMGRKKEKKGSGSLSKRIAQKSPCSVLFITEDMSLSLPENYMIPIDFSAYSTLSLELAQEVSNDSQKIKCFHIYEVPAGYTKTGKTFEEFSEIMLNNAKRDYDDFIAKNALPKFDCTFIRKSDRNRAKILMKAAKGEEIDFIIIGSRGRTDSASILIGSVAEKLIHLNNKIPMLILKKKGENMHFLEALFRV